MAEAPRCLEEMQARIAGAMPAMPKRLRQCAAYIAAHGDRIAVSTVADIAAGADLPASAVMRFCQVIGFSGFSEMQKLYRDAYVPRWPDYSTRIDRLKLGGAGSPMGLLAEFVEAGRLSLENLAKTLDEEAMVAAVEILARAQTLHIIGLRRAYPAASYLAYAFEKMNISAMLHDGVGQLDHRHALRAGDALIAISYAPYSQETIALAQFAQSQNLPVVSLTDTAASPLVPLSRAHLMLQEVDFGAFRALSATLALAITLAVAVAAARE